MNAVGDREVIFSHFFIVPAGESASFEVDSIKAKIRMEFPPDDPTSNETETKWTFSNGTLVIVFKGWKNPLGGGFLRPAKLGDLPDGRPLGFNVMIYSIGGGHFVNVQLYAGGTYP